MPINLGARRTALMTRKASGFLDLFKAQNDNVLPTYIHPTNPYITQAAGTLSDLSAWTKPTDPGGNIAFGNGRIIFQSNAGLQAARFTLATTIVNGTKVRVRWRKFTGTGGVRLRFTGAALQNITSQAPTINGWYSTDVTTTGDKTGIEVVCLGGTGPAEVGFVSIENVATGEKYVIYIVAGQSNSEGASSIPPDPEIDIAHPNFLMWPGNTSSGYATTDGLITGARAPLQMITPSSNGLSPWFSAGNRLVGKTTLGANEKILLVLCAKGGTKLQGADAEWNKAGNTGAGGTLYSNMISDALAAKGINSSRWGGVLWCQGESDAPTGYDTAFAGLISNVRSDLSAPSLPFITLGLNTFSPSVNQNMIALQATLDKDVSGTGLAGNYYVGWQSAWGNGSSPEAGNDVHFSPDAQRLRGIYAINEALRRGAIS